MMPVALMVAGLMGQALALVPPPPPIRNSAALSRLIAKGASGVMAGRGFESPAALFAERDRWLMALKRAPKQIGSMIG
jgi:3-hydroxybutyryl-CoA dehydrogenase